MASQQTSQVLSYHFKPQRYILILTVHPCFFFSYDSRIGRFCCCVGEVRSLVVQPLKEYLRHVTIPILARLLLNESYGNEPHTFTSHYPVNFALTQGTELQASLRTKPVPIERKYYLGPNV